MLKDNRIILIPVSVIASFFIIFIFFAIFPKPANKPFPKPFMQDQSQLTKKEQVYWFIEFSAKNQKSTAYTDESYAPQAASGNNYRLGTVAVHPLYPLQYGGSALKSIIPFGTTIYLQEPIEIHDQWYDSFVVNDTGDVNYRLWGDSPYWLDVYIGKGNNYNIKAAGSYGIKSVNYTWYEPWLEY